MVGLGRWSEIAVLIRLVKADVEGASALAARLLCIGKGR